MDFFVRKRTGKNITVALPASILSVLPSLREKTFIVGVIARVLSIFRVNKLIVYRDKDSSRRDVLVFREVINYVLIPPYLRRILVKKKPILRYVGLIRPLQIPSHIVSLNPVEGEYREGVIIKAKNNTVQVDIGLAKPVLIRIDKDYTFRKRQRIIVFIEKTNPLKARIIEDKNKVDVYWGFDFKLSNSIIDIINEFKGEKKIVIATSKYGEYIGDIRDSINRDLKTSNDILILFGGPRKGLYEIFADEGLRLENNVDYVVNFVRNQGTKTIRTEEALPIVLSIIDFLLEQ